MIGREIEQLKQHIENKMNHKYVDIYVQRPIIDDFSLELLYYAMNDVKIDDKQARAHITAIILVQTALNAHELVQNEDDYVVTDQQKKEKQLLVLAGDYYSGLYYLLLSEIKDVHMVECLAKGIQEVNEKKMQLYYSEYSNFDELIELLLEIHTIIIARVSSHLFQTSVSNIIEKIVCTHFLLQELNHEESIINSYIRQHAIHIKESKLQILHDRIHGYVQEIEEQMNHEDVLSGSLKQLVQYFLNSEVNEFHTYHNELYIRNM